MMCNYSIQNQEKFEKQISCNLKTSAFVDNKLNIGECG